MDFAFKYLLMFTIGFICEELTIFCSRFYMSIVTHVLLQNMHPSIFLQILFARNCLNYTIYFASRQLLMFQYRFASMYLIMFNYRFSLYFFSCFTIDFASKQLLMFTIDFLSEQQLMCYYGFGCNKLLFSKDLFIQVIKK